MFGQVVKSGKLDESIDVSKLRAGIYMLEVILRKCRSSDRTFHKIIDKLKEDFLLFFPFFLIGFSNA